LPSLLESAFLGLFLFGEKRLGPRWHWVAAFMVFFGSWLSGYFIIATDAWMQHPVAYEIAADGAAHLTGFWGLLFNPWAGWMYVHNMSGALITGAFVMMAVGAFYLLSARQAAFGRLFLRTGLVAAVVACLFQAFPSGDQQSKMVAFKQPVTMAAMEGLFNNEAGAPLVIIGQPTRSTRRCCRRAPMRP
jgi:cytochrome bd ubiquinol oxidase subunit I